jgi:hypothetical protein
MASTTTPTWADHYALTKADATELAEALRARGYLAGTEHTGTCSLDADGGHWHPSGVVVRLTPEQARKLARRP